MIFFSEALDRSAITWYNMIEAMMYSTLPTHEKKTSQVAAVRSCSFQSGVRGAVFHPRSRLIADYLLCLSSHMQIPFASILAATDSTKFVMYSITTNTPSLRLFGSLRSGNIHIIAYFCRFVKPGSCAPYTLSDKWFKIDLRGFFDTPLDKTEIMWYNIIRTKVCITLQTQKRPRSRYL